MKRHLLSLLTILLLAACAAPATPAPATATITATLAPTETITPLPSETPTPTPTVTPTEQPKQMGSLDVAMMTGAELTQYQPAELLTAMYINPDQIASYGETLVMGEYKGKPAIWATVDGKEVLLAATVTSVDGEELFTRVDQTADGKMTIFVNPNWSNGGSVNVSESTADILLDWTVTALKDQGAGIARSRLLSGPVEINVPVGVSQKSPFDIEWVKQGFDFTKPAEVITIGSEDELQKLMQEMPELGGKLMNTATSKTFGGGVILAGPDGHPIFVSVSTSWVETLPVTMSYKEADDFLRSHGKDWGYLSGTGSSRVADNIHTILRAWARIDQGKRAFGNAMTQDGLGNTEQRKAMFATFSQEYISEFYSLPK